MFQTLDDLPAESRLLVRLDLNSPVEDGQVRDNARFARHAETVQELADDGHAVACMAHQGRPGRDDFTDLSAHADILSAHLDGVDVAYVPDVYGDDAVSAVRGLDAGDVCLLENVRSVEDELADRTPAEHARSEFVQTLAPEFDAYVGDAYSVAHRAHASIVGFPRVLDPYAGRVMVAEYEANSAIQTREFDGEVTMVLGGTKAEDLIPLVEALDDKVDTFLLGGVVGELFLRAEGYDVGFDVDDSALFDGQWADHEGTIRATLDEYGDRLELPRDLAYEDASGERAEVDVDDAEKTTPFLDVGAATSEVYRKAIDRSAAVFVKGALGVFEDERFSHGTRRALRAIAHSDCFSVVGGGDTARAVGMYGFDRDDFDHVSIAGGAYVTALTGDPLPGVEALRVDD